MAIYLEVVAKHSLKVIDMSKKTIAFKTPDLMKAAAALRRYERRQARDEHPEGAFDKGGRWYPKGKDEEVMGSVRSPSRSFPNSYNLACRSLAHCERYEGADHQIVLALKREFKKAGVDDIESDDADSVIHRLRLDVTLDENLPASNITHKASRL